MALKDIGDDTKNVVTLYPILESWGTTATIFVDHEPKYNNKSIQKLKTLLPSLALKLLASIVILLRTWAYKSIMCPLSCLCKMW